MINYPQQLLFWSAEVIFPIKCVICGKLNAKDRRVGNYLCKKCSTSIPIFSVFRCIGCEKQSPVGTTCNKCQTLWTLDQLLACSDYNNPGVEKIIKSLKYRFIKDLALPISSIIERCLKSLVKTKKYNIASGNPIIIPVPLHKRRLNWRGFNQSEIIAEFLASAIQLEFKSKILKKISASKPQADITDKDARLENLGNRFSITDPTAIRGREIILVDDIATTGATLNECAKVLKQSGAKKITGLVFARG